MANQNKDSDGKPFYFKILDQSNIDDLSKIKTIECNCKSKIYEVAVIILFLKF